MAGIGASNEEKRQLAMKGYSDPVIIADGPTKITYHNPKTGKEMVLPADAYNITHYLSRGLMIGPTPNELKVKYESEEPEVISNTIYGADLPPELQPEDSKLSTEVAELKKMVKILLEAQTSKGSVPNSKAKDEKKSVIIEEEEEIDVPYDTQLGFII